MATSVFKTFLDSDKTTTRTLLHEYIPITGTLMSGTYGGTSTYLGSEPHVKSFTHGMFQSVYDYPHLSSSANHVMDISVGLHESSQLAGHRAKLTVASVSSLADKTLIIVDSFGFTNTITFKDHSGDADLANNDKWHLVATDTTAKTRAIKVAVAAGTTAQATLLADCLGANQARSKRSAAFTANETTRFNGTHTDPVFGAVSSAAVLHLVQPTSTVPSTLQVTGTAVTDSKITVNSAFTAPATDAMVSKKLNMYAQMSQILMGYDTSNNVAQFDEDGIATNTENAGKMSSAIFISLSRLISKDEIKKGSFKMDLDVLTVVDNDGTMAATQLAAVANTTNQSANASTAKIIRITDAGMATGYKTGSPAGEVGILVANTQTTGDMLTTDDGTQKVGLIYYQAGIVVLTSSVFSTADDSVSAAGATFTPYMADHRGLLKADGSSDKIAVGYKSVPGSGNYTAAHVAPWIDILADSKMDRAADFVRSRIVDLTFNNTTELNSTVYFCRARHNEFNYSANRTYLDGSKIRVKKLAQDLPRTYITTVGLYSANNELMAVAKLSEPIRKDPTNEATVRVRLDY